MDFQDHQDAYFQGNFPASRIGPLSRGRGRGFADPALFPQDIITDDEILSDSYDLKEVGGIVYEADCAMITEGGVEVGSSFPLGGPGVWSAVCAGCGKKTCERVADG